jgi:hypothetical protein
MLKDGVEIIGSHAKPLAIVIRASASVESIQFFSPRDFPQQIGLMSRPSGYEVPLHVHNFQKREINTTQEVLFVRSGKCLVRIFDTSSGFDWEIVLNSGDVILLASGAHGITMLENTEILEVKQGPYSELEDKTLL